MTGSVFAAISLNTSWNINANLKASGQIGDSIIKLLPSKETDFFKLQQQVNDLKDPMQIGKVLLNANKEDILYALGKTRLLLESLSSDLQLIPNATDVQSFLPQVTLPNIQSLLSSVNNIYKESQKRKPIARHNQTIDKIKAEFLKYSKKVKQVEKCRLGLTTFALIILLIVSIFLILLVLLNNWNRIFFRKYRKKSHLV